MLNQFTKPDTDIIEYISGKGRVESSVLFKHITGINKKDREIENKLRAMLGLYGYRLRRQCVDRMANVWGDSSLRCFSTNTTVWYYSISQYKRMGCYPCGIPINDPHMSRCYHWQKCHYGIDGKCQLACITMN